VDFCLSNAMHGQNINLPVSFCVVTYSQGGRTDFNAQYAKKDTFRAQMRGLCYLSHVAIGLNC